MEKLTQNEIEKSSLYLDLSEGLLNRIDLFLCNVDLTQKQKESLIKLFEESYGEGYINEMTD